MTSRPPIVLHLVALVALVPGSYLIALGGDGPAGGGATVALATSHAYSQPAPTLDEEERDLHRRGDRVFGAAFVTAPAPVHGGLGPLYNETGCVACHARDGRTPGALLLRVSVPGADAHGGPRPAPHVGLQVQDRAVFGQVPEARVDVTWTERTERLADGTEVTLRVPTYSLGSTAQPLPPDLLVSPRAPRPVFGLGLLEAVPDSALVALAARQARDGEVSGRVNAVWDPVEQRQRVGRFGHKATHATLRSQAVSAFREDVGVTSDLAPDPDGAAPEVGRTDLDALTFYLQTLAVPDQRHRTDPNVRRGRQLFRDVGCASCHVPELQTGPLDGVPAASNQTIHPYTDLLLHDMGDGLDDGRPEFGAAGTEWRTPPLWGIGLSEVVNANPGFLHDGRARTLEEAVVWHGGEAAPAREHYRRLTTPEREALLAFLRSL